MLFLSFHTAIHAQFNTPTFNYPDINGIVITEFNLRNNEVIRGRTMSVVPFQYYEVKIASRRIIQIPMAEVSSFQKSLSDLRENTAYSDYGFTYLWSSNESGDMALLRYNIRSGKDFGHDFSWSYFLDIGFPLFVQGIDIDQDYFEVSRLFLLQLGLGHRFNRLKKVSQGIMLGSSFGFFPFETSFVFGEFELPITVFHNMMFVPCVSYHHPISPGMPPLLGIGLRFRTYSPGL